MIREETGYDADMSTMVPLEKEKKVKRKTVREVSLLSFLDYRDHTCFLAHLSHRLKVSYCDHRIAINNFF